MQQTGRLTDFLEKFDFIQLGGPYGTELALEYASGIEKNKLKLPFSALEALGVGISALLSEKGREYIENLTVKYLRSVGKTVPLILPTNSFGIDKQRLERAARSPEGDSSLASTGLELVLVSIEIAKKAIRRTRRSKDSTLIAHSIAPPFDCYIPEATPEDIRSKWLPQTLSAVRFGKGIDYLMFETVPSISAAIGAAQAFKDAHSRIDASDSNVQFSKSGSLTYMESLMSRSRFFRGDLCKSYNKKEKVFEKIEPQLEYVISLNLNEAGQVGVKKRDGKVRYISLNQAITQLYDAIKKQGLYKPAGITINCNSLEVTEKALKAVSRHSPENLKKIIGMHANASPENDRRMYGSKTDVDAHPLNFYVTEVARIAKAYDLKILGGCCGTNQNHMKEISTAMSK